MSALEDRITSLEEKMEKVIKTNEEIKELLEFFKTVRIGVNAIATIFRILRWIGACALLLWGILYAVKHGTMPPNPL